MSESADSGVSPVGEGRYRAGDVLEQKYVLVKKRGEGGMGTIWVAHNSVLDVHCAVKIMELDGSAPSRAAAKRVLDEARAAARLGHASIIRVLDYGETDRGDPFIAMELLEGEDLAQVLDRKGKLPPTLAVQTLLPIAHALASAHAKGIVHRDVKPENIFLAHDEVTTTLPKLLDFGVVRIVNNPRKLTMDGAVVGTPDYMSPEQARGKTTTGQTDLWSLCVVLYETIAGRRPFDGDNYNALMRSIIEDEPPTLADLGASDTDLSFVIQRGLVKDPKERWMTMRELGEELALWLQDQGVTEDVTGASLKRGWLADTESQRIELPPYVRQVLESGIVQPGPQSGSNPRIVAPVSGSQPQISEPDLAAIADMNRGGDPEELLLRATRRRNVAIIIGLIVTVLVATLFVLIGTGIIVTSE
ncbi:MAG: serine/threonine protein kinase [Myxococcales bacterium]|nr:serine/threonine protein kinase [Myxococcales bacterium]MCB9578498.1 serine/threonine protein kinase [Polyangiaceae bacterium]